MPFMHLPVQSGSDRVLESMNRKHTAKDYLLILEKLRAARSDMAFSSDFIIGFPGESDADFAATLALVRGVNYAQAFSFKYSRRPGTPAAAMPDQIEESVQDARLQELQNLLRQQQENFNQRTIGHSVPVLFENISEHEGCLFGRTPYMQAVRTIAPRNLVGEELPVTIEKAGFNMLTGSLTMADAA